MILRRILWLVLLSAHSQAATGQLFLQAFEGPRPVKGLAVFVFDKRYETNQWGSLLIESAPIGKHQLRFTQADEKVDLHIESGQETFISVEVQIHDDKKNIQAKVESPEKKYENPISSSAVSLKSTGEIVVLAPRSRISISALLEQRKSSSGVSEVLGAEQMSRQGDSDAASSLRRVTGLTLRDGKYVFVRGMGDRYSATMLNGFYLPSPEPSRKVVPLDLFPVQILDSVQVQKSYRSVYGGEFGGGLIQLETKTRPTSSTTHMSISLQSSPDSKYLSYQGGGSDHWGKDDGTRKIPSRVQSALNSGKKLIESSDPNSGFSKSELRDFGTNFRKNYNTFSKPSETLPSLNLALTRLGKVEKWKWGLNSSLSYLTDSDIREESISAVEVSSPGQTVVSESGEQSQWEIDRKLALMMDVSADYNSDHKARLTLMGLRHSTDETSVRVVSGSGVNDFSRRRTRTEWTERELFAQQLQTEHELNSAQRLKFTFGRAQVRRDSPDQKEYIYRQITSSDAFTLDPEVSGNMRTFSELRENSHDIGGNWSLKSNWGTSQLGASYFERFRDSNTYRFQYKKDYLAGQEPDLSLNPDQIFSQNQNWILVNQTGTADSYRGRQRVNSLYFEQSYLPSEQWELIAGLRSERAQQTVETFFYFDPSIVQSSNRSRDRDLFPSFSMNWKPQEQWRVRFSYGETMARPDFRELSTVRYIDEETGYEARGNPDLAPSILYNFDQRIEYYFEADEYVSLGFFYKRFKDPIEDVFLPVAGNLLKVPQNAKSAENKGVELESRFSLRRWNREFRRWSLAGNISLIDSQVSLNAESNSQLTSLRRALQGQSPYILNVGLFYDRPLSGIQSGLLVNQLGRRITEVGTDFRPDIYEEPYPQLDWVISQKDQQGRSWNFKMKNLLDPKVISRQGDQVIRSYKKGIDLSAGVSWTL